MTLAHARALLHRWRVCVQQERPEEDLAALHALARWAVRFTPTVAADPSDGLLLDATGCERLYHGEGNLVAAISRAMERLGLRARLAIAPTFGAAWALARFAPDAVTILAEGAAITPALAPLPVAALRVDEDAVAGLATVGVDRIGQLLALPRAQLADRFGEPFVRRIDQALGHAPEAIEPVRVMPPPRVERAFDGPVKQVEAIEWAVRELVAELCSILRRRGSGARQLRLHLERAEAEPVTEMLELSRPTRDTKHLWALLRPKVERLHLGHGVDGVRLTATRCDVLPLSQAEFIAGDPVAGVDDHAEMGRLIDLLSGRLGSDRVLAADPVDTHVPEKAFRWRPAGEPPPIKASPMGSLSGDRPTMLLERPQPIEVAMLRPEGPILLVRGEEPRRVITTIGPERIRPRWWRSQPEAIPGAPGALPGIPGGPPTRDYYKLQVEDGRWLWVFRVLDDGRWFLHGAWE